MSKSNEITIQEYTGDDWCGICRVHDLARPYELKGSCDPRAFVPLANDPDAVDVYTSQKFVACDGKCIIGFVGIDRTYVSYLYVDPAYFGRGIGRRLLRLTLDLIGPNAWTISLEGNTPARHLYESEGFKLVRTFEGDNAGYLCVAVRLELSPQDRG